VTVATATPGVRSWERLALAALLALGAVLLSRSIGAFSADFDEQVYLATADLLQRGGNLGTEVFGSQPPLFFALLDGVFGLVDGSPVGVRAAAVALTLLGAVAAWALVRRIAGPRAALVAAALLVLSPSVVENAAVVSASVPAMVLGTAALVAARAAGERHVAWAAAAGALLAAALLVKLLAAVFVVAFLAGALVRRPSPAALGLFLAGALAVAAAVGLAYVSALEAIYRDAVGFHLTARDATVVLPTEKPLDVVVLMTAAFLGLLGLFVAGVSRIPAGERRAWMRERAELLGLLAGGLLLCALQRPLLQHHLVVLAFPLALLTATCVPPRLTRRVWLVTGLALVLILPWVGHGRSTLEGAELQRVERAASLAASFAGPDEAVVSDLPIVPVMAHRRSAPQTVDPSYVRVGTGSLDRDDVLRAAESSGAVVVGRAFERIPGLEATLLERYGQPAAAGGIRIYRVRPS
jgi:4-amino-4-deoxy-L-arabinose transferase-like glycosyltransferase